MMPRPLLDELQRELDWIETNSRPVIGEHGAWLESWANVRLTLARLGAAVASKPDTAAVTAGPCWEQLTDTEKYEVARRQASELDSEFECLACGAFHAKDGSFFVPIKEQP